MMDHGRLLGQAIKSCQIKPYRNLTFYTCDGVAVRAHINVMSSRCGTLQCGTPLALARISLG